jgi:uncharacterized protein
MQYSTGSIGRVFVVRFDDGDDLIECIKEVARKEGIKAGVIQLLGGMQCASMVCGPKDTVRPPEPMWEGFSDGREVLGFGTIFLSDGEPSIHLHGAVGRNKETLTGCIRTKTRVFLLVEAVITEIIGINATKKPDAQSGITMLRFE